MIGDRIYKRECKCSVCIFAFCSRKCAHFVVLWWSGPNSPSGRTDRRTDDGRTAIRTDRWTADGGRRTDGQAAASTALSTPQSPMLSTLDFRRGVRMPSMAFDFAFLQHFLSLLIPIRILILSLILILVGIGFCLCLLYGPCGVTSDHA